MESWVIPSGNSARPGRLPASGRRPVWLHERRPAIEGDSRDGEPLRLGGWFK